MTSSGENLSDTKGIDVNGLAAHELKVMDLDHWQAFCKKLMEEGAKTGELPKAYATLRAKRAELEEVARELGIKNTDLDEMMLQMGEVKGNKEVPPYGRVYLRMKTDARGAVGKALTEKGVEMTRKIAGAAAEIEATYREALIRTAFKKYGDEPAKTATPSKKPLLKAKPVGTTPTANGSTADDDVAFNFLQNGAPPSASISGVNITVEGDGK